MQTRNREHPLDKINRDSYSVPKGEAHLIHVKIESKQFNPKTGERLSTPRIVKYGQKEWKIAIKNSLRQQGYDVEVLHDPNMPVQQVESEKEEQVVAPTSKRGRKPVVKVEPEEEKEE